jgi:hypothetical protein
MKESPESHLEFDPNHDYVGEMSPTGDAPESDVDASPNFSEDIQELAQGISIEANQEIHPGVRARTFEEARKISKLFSDAFISKGVEQSLVGPDGEKAFFVKTYLDQALPDQEEQVLAKDPVGLSELHETMSQMIASHLKISTANLSEEERMHIREQKKKYVDRLKKDSEELRGILQSYMIEKKFPRTYANQAEFFGLTLETPQGMKDITDTSTRSLRDGVRSSISIQREAVAQFIHWESEEYARARLAGEDVMLKRRIYLNPRTARAIEIFSKIIGTLDLEQIRAQAKVLDRSYELTQQAMTSARPIRTDAIVIYVEEKDADRVLEVALRLFDETPSDFVGRATPKIPTMVAPGIAVGDEPDVPGQSLTSHRTDIIEEAFSRVRSELGPIPKHGLDDRMRQKAVTQFKKVFPVIATEHGVDPENIAFNLGSHAYPQGA